MSKMAQKKKTIINYKSSPPRSSEKIKKIPVSKKKSPIAIKARSDKKQKKITFKTIKIAGNPYGYKYNVQTYIDGSYAGHGRFCKTMDEVNQYKKSVR